MLKANHPYFLTQCEHCGWVGSSEECGEARNEDDADVTCASCGRIFLCDEMEQAEVIERLQAGLEESYRQIRLLAEAGVDRLADYGVKVDPAERTYVPIIDRIKAVCTQSVITGN